MTRGGKECIKDLFRKHLLGNEEEKHSDLDFGVISEKSN